MKTNEQQNVIHHNEPDRLRLVSAWLREKATEEAARQRRVAIEELLLPLVETKPEGSKTTDIEGFKVTVKCGLNYKLEPEGFGVIEKELPENLRPVKTKKELDEKGVQYLRSNEPALYAIFAPYLTVKPAKPSFTIAVPSVVADLSDLTGAA